jgi:hypothetical protein
LKYKEVWKYGENKEAKFKYEYSCFDDFQKLIFVFHIHIFKKNVLGSSNVDLNIFITTGFVNSQLFITFTVLLDGCEIGLPCGMLAVLRVGQSAECISSISQKYLPRQVTDIRPISARV